MNNDKLVAALNELGNSTTERVELIARSRGAPIEARIAAILLTVSFSDLPIALVATELICDLTDPEWSNPKSDPFDTPVGTLIAKFVKSSPRETPEPVKAQIALRVVHLAKNSAGVPDDHLNFGLLALTGKDGWWWLDWIREQADD